VVHGYESVVDVKRGLLSVLDIDSVLSDADGTSDGEELGPGTVNVLVIMTVELNSEVSGVELGEEEVSIVELGVTSPLVVPENDETLLEKTGETSVVDELLPLL
jgi:hypothetical protein